MERNDTPDAGLTDTNRTLQRIREVVGEAHLSTDPTGIAAYSRDTSLWSKTCAAVVHPASTDEVARVIRIAAESRLAVWPFSGGKNWGYGASMGFREGALIMVLDRMDQILTVDEPMAVALIEPGVTQGQLNAYLKTNGINLWADCTDSTPKGSVIGNALERGVGYTPYWDHFAHLCGMEVVLPNGDIVRTGGGPEGSRTWNLHKWGTGPYLEGLFSQSNLGVVTQAGVWLMPAPDAFGCFLCEVADEKDQPALVDTLRQLVLRRVISSNVHIVNDVMLLAQMIQYPYDMLGGGTHLSPDMRAVLRSKYRIAPWTVSGGLYGPASHVRGSRRIIKQELSRFGRVTLLNDTSFGVLSAVTSFWERHSGNQLLASIMPVLLHASIEKLGVIRHIYPILKGIPGEDIVGFAYFKSRRGRPKTDVDPARDGAGLMWLAVACPMSGKDSARLVSLCRDCFESHGLDLSVTFIMVNARTALGLVEIFYDKDNPEESARAQSLYDTVTDVTERDGFPQYRTSVAYGDRILNRAPAFQRLANALKTAIDPANVLAPGRYGIGLP